MSIIDQQKDLENFPDQLLMQLGQAPDPEYPPYLVITEIERRTDMRKRYQVEMQKHQAANPPNIATQRINEMISRFPRIMGGISGLDLGMGQGEPPQGMPDPGMAQMGGLPPGMDQMQGMEGPPPGMAYGGLIESEGPTDDSDPEELRRLRDNLRAALSQGSGQYFTSDGRARAEQALQQADSALAELELKSGSYSYGPYPPGQPSEDQQAPASDRSSQTGAGLSGGLPIEIPDDRSAVPWWNDTPIYDSLGVSGLIGAGLGAIGGRARASFQNVTNAGKARVDDESGMSVARTPTPPQANAADANALLKRIEEGRTAVANRLLGDMEPNDPRFIEGLLDSDRQVMNWDPIMFEAGGSPDKPGVMTQTRGDLKKFRDFQRIWQQIADDPGAADYYRSKGYDLSSKDGFIDSAYTTNFMGFSKPKAADYDSDLARKTIAARGQTPSPVPDTFSQRREDQAAIADQNARNKVMNDKLAEFGAGRRSVQDIVDGRQREIEAARVTANTLSPDEVSLSQLRNKEATRETELLATELGLSTNRVAELRREMRTEKEIDHTRKARLLSGLGAALMGNPRNLGSALQGTTTGLQDLDEALRVERRRDLGDVYDEGAKGIDIERSGRRGIASLKASDLEMLVARARAGDSDAQAALTSLTGQEIQAASAYEQMAMQIRRAANGGDLGDLMPYNTFEDMVGDEIHRINQRTDLSKELKLAATRDLENALSAYRNNNIQLTVTHLDNALVNTPRLGVP